MFKFRLEPVLELRTWKEEQKQLVFAERQRILRQELEKKARLQDLRGQYFEAMREEVAKEDLSVTNISFYQSYLFWLDRAIAKQDEKVQKARALANEAKRELLEARKEKEVLVKTKERAHTRYKQAEAMLMQKALDDVSTVQFVRRARGIDHLSAKT